GSGRDKRSRVMSPSASGVEPKSNTGSRPTRPHERQGLSWHFRSSSDSVRVATVMLLPSTGWPAPPRAVRQHRNLRHVAEASMTADRPWAGHRRSSNGRDGTVRTAQVRGQGATTQELSHVGNPLIAGAFELLERQTHPFVSIV